MQFFHRIAARRALLCILCLALAVRLAVAVVVEQRIERRGGEPFLIAGDAAGYWELGRKLAHGEDYSLYDPPRKILRMPGFPAVLAVSIKLFGDRIFAARLLLAVIGTATCWMVYVLGKRLVDESTGLWAAGLAAISPTLAGFSVLILSETTFALGLIISLWAMLRLCEVDNGPNLAPRSRGLLWACAVGASIALATYVRPSWLLAAPLFAMGHALAACRKPQAVLHGGVVVLVTLLCLSPWAWRNHQVSGHWVFTTLWVGPSLYDGLNPAADGDSDLSFFDAERKGDTLSEYDVDRHYRARAWEFARENPGRAVELAGLKFLRFWKPWPNAEQFSDLWLRAAVAAFFLPLVGLSLRGAWISRGNWPAWLLSAGPILYFTAIHLVFVGSLRYRLPAEYPLCILSAVGIQSLRTGRKSLGQENSQYVT